MVGETAWLARFDELLADAEEVGRTAFSTARPLTDAFTGSQVGKVPGRMAVKLEPFTRWAVSARHAIEQVFGADSVHAREFEKSLPDGSNTAAAFIRCKGVLGAARDDLAGGYVRSVRELVSAEVFDDLIEQAEHLLARGYHLPAGALAGAVLEDALRKLCGKHGVTWQGDSSISKLATELYKADHLTKPRHGQIEAWGKLRNQIDHGDFSNPGDVEKQDVRRMVDGVRDFVARFLG